MEPAARKGACQQGGGRGMAEETGQERREARTTGMTDYLQNIF